MLNAPIFTNDETGTFGSRRKASSNETRLGERVTSSPWEGLYLEQAYAHKTPAH